MAAVVPPPSILVVGTAHVVDLTGPLRGVLEPRPLDGIAIELDAERAQVVFAPPGAPVGPRPSAAGTPLFARLWSVIQRRLGADLGAGVPGAEMRAAAAVAKQRGLPLFLVDDPVRATLVRLLRSMPVRERVNLVLGSVLGLFVPTSVVVGEMNRYTEDSTALLEELRRASPTVVRVLIDERNERMAERLDDIQRRGFSRLAVVVGDAHVPGISTALGRRGFRVETVTFRQLRAAKGPSSSPA